MASQWKLYKQNSCEQYTPNPERPTDANANYLAKQLYMPELKEKESFPDTNRPTDSCPLETILWTEQRYKQSQEKIEKKQAKL